MKRVTLFLSASIICFSQDMSQKNPNLNNFYTINSASFFNYGTSGYEIDGFIEFQIKNRFFIESSINYEIGNKLSLNFGNDHTYSLSSSFGTMKNITKNSYAVGGFSNYTERNNDNLNEVFIGMISKYLTGIFYVGIGGSLAPNFLGIVDINSFLKNNIPIDISIMITYSAPSIEGRLNKGNTNEKGLDAFLRLSKDYNSGISVGYNLSHERYETFESRIFQKSGGKTFEKNISIIDIGFFHTFHFRLYILNEF